MPTRPPTHTAILRQRNPAAYARATDALERQRFYNSAAWRNLAKRKRANSPLCEDCASRGITTKATEVHHLVKLADDPHHIYSLDEDYTRSLCESCHSVRTRRGE